jgi:hypothetical protein
MTPVAAMAAVTMEVNDTILNLSTLSDCCRWRSRYEVIVLGGRPSKVNDSRHLYRFHQMDRRTKIDFRRPGLASMGNGSMVTKCDGHLSACS